MILDKLVEKKDMIIYIEQRVIQQENQMILTIKDSKEEYREFLKNKFKGRIDELKRLKVVIEHGELKDQCKKMMRSNVIINEKSKESE